MLDRPVDRIIKALVLSPFVSQKMTGFTVKPIKEDLQFMRHLIEASVLTPTIDKTYPLSEVHEVIRYFEAGHARGKVVVCVPKEGADNVGGGLLDTEPALTGMIDFAKR